MWAFYDFFQFGEQKEVTPGQIGWIEGEAKEFLVWYLSGLPWFPPRIPYWKAGLYGNNAIDQFSLRPILVYYFDVVYMDRDEPFKCPLDYYNVLISASRAQVSKSKN